MKIYRRILIIVMTFVSLLTLTFGLNYNVIASENYYNSISSSLVKEDLKNALRTLITDTHKYQTTYSDCSNASYVAKTDADPNKEGNIILFWSGLSVPATWDSGKTWNREHVWPKSNSWFHESGAGSDLHHIRPTDPSVNNSHGNFPYGEIDGSLVKTSSTNGSVLTDCEQGGSYFEPAENRKGDTARIIFYLLTRYSQADDYMDGNISNGEVTQVIQDFDILLQWNNQDPVDSFERTRNDAVQEIQGNRNPFIDNSDYANLIWGETTSTNPYYSVNVEYDQNACSVQLSGNKNNEGKVSGQVSINVTVNDNYSYLGLKNSSTGEIVTTERQYIIDNVDKDYNFVVVTEKALKYQLVNDATGLEIGSEIIVVASESDYALSSTQNTNNRGQEEVIKNNKYVIANSNVQKLTLEAGNIDNTYAFNTGNGYLYAASSNENYLNTETTLSNNSSWSISINNGVASIVAQGDNTRNVLKYNETSKLFSCYAQNNTQKEVSIYKVYDDIYSEFESQVTMASVIIYYESSSTSSKQSYNYTFTSKMFTDTNTTLELGNILWTNVNDGGYYGYDGTKGQQFGSGSKPAKTLVLTSEKVYDLKSISINMSGASNVDATVVVKVGDTQIGDSVKITTTATTYTFESSEALSGVIKIEFTQASSKALYVKSISFDYLEVQADYNMTNGGIRFGTCISKELYDKLNSDNTEWGVEYYIGIVEDWNHIDASEKICTPARVEYEGASVVSEDGGYYQFALTITGIKYSTMDTDVSARVFVRLNGETYYMSPVTYSFRDVVNKYLSLEDTSSIEEHLGILNHIKDYAN